MDTDLFFQEHIPTVHLSTPGIIPIMFGPWYSMGSTQVNPSTLQQCQLGSMWAQDGVSEDMVSGSILDQAMCWCLPWVHLLWLLGW